jgi:hypothetical protein
MTYELAKQLKDAGFPLRIVNRHEWEFKGDLFEGLADDLNDAALAPTLSELIEACACPRFNLQSQGNVLWVADCGTKSRDGSTPEEAVAKLWLALNSESHPSA